MSLELLVVMMPGVLLALLVLASVRNSAEAERDRRR